MGPLRSRRSNRVLHLSDSDDDLDVCVIPPPPPPPPPLPPTRSLRLPPSPSIDEEVDDISVEDDPLMNVDPPAASPTFQEVARESTTPVAPPSPPRHTHEGYSRNGEVNPLEQFSHTRGVFADPRWLASCVRDLQMLYPGFTNFGVERQGEIVFGHFLVADLNLMGASCLPPSVESLHATELAGPFVLQVDEITDIGSPMRERYHKRAATPARCLKLSITDGVQRVFGIEYRPIHALHCLSPSGLKICVRNVCVRHGVFLLVPEIVEVLGGFVQSLEEGRQRAVQEVNKPARGNRNRRGSMADRPLLERATSAAWPDNSVHGILEAVPTPRAHTNLPTARLIQIPVADRVHSSVAQVGLDSGPQVASPSGTAQHQQTSFVSGIETTVNVSVKQAVPGFVAQAVTNTSERQTVSISGEQPRPTSRLEVNAQLGSQWAQAMVTDQLLQDSNPQVPTNILGRLSLGSRKSNQLQEVETSNGLLDQRSFQPIGAGEGAETPMDLDSEEEAEPVQTNVATTSQSHPTSGSDTPFTYFAHLKEKFRPELGSVVVGGTVKCVLTGVKDFQFKGCDEFKLIVHVDDGSVITEALIHHDVVQATIGFLPKEVSNALASSNRLETQKMKDILKRFQAFLKKFEGSMDVEYNQTSDVPVVLKMIESAGDINMTSLLERVNKYMILRPPGPETGRMPVGISSP